MTMNYPTPVLFSVPFGDALVSFNFAYVPRRRAISSSDPSEPKRSRAVARLPDGKTIQAFFANAADAIRWAEDSFGLYRRVEHCTALLQDAPGLVQESVVARSAFIDAALAGRDPSVQPVRPFLAA